MSRSTYSRDSFYGFEELYEKGGELVPQEITRRKPALKNYTASEIDAAVVEFAARATGVWPIARGQRTGQAGLSIAPAGCCGSGTILRL